MRNALKIYAALVGFSIQSQLQYRRAVGMQLVGHFLLFGVEFAAVVGLFASFGTIAGWTLAEAALLGGFADMTFAVADALSRGFDLLGEEIKRGEFDRVLARPVSPFLQVMGREFTLRRFGRFAQGAVIFAWGLSAAAPAPSAVGAAALVLGFAGAVVTFVSVFAVQGALSFVTVESLEAMNVFSYGGRQLSGYPLTAYRSFIRDLFLLVIPIGCSVYFPMCALLHRAPLPGLPWWSGVIAPFGCAPFALFAALAWKAGVARYESAGG